MRADVPKTSAKLAAAPSCLLLLIAGLVTGVGTTNTGAEGPQRVRRTLSRRSGPPAPTLTPLSAPRAEALGAWARQLLVANSSEAPEVMAWSMVNIACQDRAMALEYALAVAPGELPAPTAMMRGTELSAARVDELAARPAVACATINLTGPLITEQTLLRDGASLPGAPQRWYWSYHHAVVVSVEGEPRVLDLSLGDAPVPIETWYRSFVTDDVTCVHAEEAIWWQAWVYWLSMFGAFTPPPRPDPICTFTLTPMFTFRWDQQPLADFVASVPETMRTQTGGFRTILRQDYGVTLPEIEIPRITSRYQARTEADLCTWVQLPYCD